MKIKNVGDEVAEFTDDLKDPESEPFKSTTATVCSAVSI